MYSTFTVCSPLPCSTEASNSSPTQTHGPARFDAPAMDGGGGGQSSTPRTHTTRKPTRGLQTTPYLHSNPWLFLTRKIRTRHRVREHPSAQVSSSPSERDTDRDVNGRCRGIQIRTDGNGRKERGDDCAVQQAVRTILALDNTILCFAQLQLTWHMAAMTTHSGHRTGSVERSRRSQQRKRPPATSSTRNPGSSAAPQPIICLQPWGAASGTGYQ